MKRDDSGRILLPDDSPHLQGTVVRKSTYKKIIKNQYVYSTPGVGMLPCEGGIVDPPVKMRGSKWVLHRKYKIKKGATYGSPEERGWQIRVFKRYLRMTYATILSDTDVFNVQRKFEYWVNRKCNMIDWYWLNIGHTTYNKKLNPNNIPVYVYLFGKEYGPMKTTEQVNVLKSLRVKLNKLDDLEISQDCANDGWVPDHYDLELIKGGTSY